MDEQSKSERKREVTALQKLAVSLSKLPDAQLAKIPLPDELRKAIQDYQKMKAHGAMRRQAQFLGKIMRDIDTLPIIDAYQDLQQLHQRHNAEFHLIEEWRDKLQHGGRQALTEFMAAYPKSSSQTLRQLIEKARTDKTLQKNSGASKALFRYLSEVIQQHL